MDVNICERGIGASVDIMIDESVSKKEVDDTTTAAAAAAEVTEDNSVTPSIETTTDSTESEQRKKVTEKKKKKEKEKVHLGYGYALFETVEDKDLVLAAGVIRTKRKHNIHIQEIVRPEDRRNRAAEEQGVCFLWKRFACTHGEACIFKHEGEGGCVVIGRGQRRWGAVDGGRQAG